ncbi:MAG: MBL fold metallo-hydrolase [Candidatus Rokuibacteriota bacterium]|nr:MAG: MBL fold metallo-hydrolase [Candidatus Rokubacteria bacterium]
MAPRASWRRTRTSSAGIWEFNEPRRTMGAVSWIDPDFPTTATPSDRVGRVLGLNPGLFTGPGTNTYLVGAREPVLIDTGAGVAGYPPVLDAYLKARGLGRPSRIVLTHRHRDHMGGVAQLRARFPGIPVAKLRHRDPALPEPVDHLSDGQAVPADGATLIPLHTPGHASDHLCYYLVEERALFTGDLILGGSTTVIPPDDGDLGDYLRSLERVRALDVRRIYPAHGPVIEDPRATIREYVEHRHARERQILERLGGGPATIPEIVGAIYAGVSPALHGAAAMSVESHLRKLAGEGRVREQLRPGEASRWGFV